MTEVTFLNCLLFLGFILAPLSANKLLLNNSKLYSDLQKTAFTILLIGAIFNLSCAAFVWPLFCIFGFLLYLKNEYKYIFTAKVIARGIPFVFSIISSVWFVAAVYDLHLLGYNKEWSYYAALHGCFLGWIFIGGAAFLSAKENVGRVYLCACYLCLILFLFVAFGIDGVPYIKRIGVVGFSVIVPFVIGMYAFNLKKENLRSLIFSSISLISIILSMILALLNEFWMNFPKNVLGLPTMVLIHGFVNAALVLPLFILAIILEYDEKDPMSEFKENVIFFDGICVLCNRTVAALIHFDKNKKLRYSSLQGEYIKKIPGLNLSGSGRSVVFWSKGGLYERAEAVTQILIELGGQYKFMGFVLKIFPLFTLNWLYDFIANNRYRLFGKNETCLIPSGETKDLFIP